MKIHQIELFNLSPCFIYGVFLVFWPFESDSKEVRLNLPTYITEKLSVVTVTIAPNKV